MASEQSATTTPEDIPPQTQDQRPGLESEMTPAPEFQPLPKAEGRLEGKVALITGGDSGIGRATAVAFAENGCDVAISYLEEHDDAEVTQQEVESHGRRCLRISGDIGSEANCIEAVRKVVVEFGKLDILVNNAAEQHPQESITDITSEQLERTFRTNIFSFFYMTKAALPHLKEGSSIINCTSVTAYKGSPKLLDYSSTKGAIVAFTRSLAVGLAEKKIRVNGVAPGPIWTPLIPSTFDEEAVDNFGKNTALGRPGEPKEVATCFLFLASEEASYITGQVLHPNGGEIVNG